MTGSYARAESRTLSTLSRWPTTPSPWAFGKTTSLLPSCFMMFAKTAAFSPRTWRYQTDVRDAVRLLTRVKGEPLGPYYREISENRVATLEKVREYIDETREYILPLLRQAKNQWPSDSNLFFVLKYHIISVIDGLEACLQAISIASMAEPGAEREEDICL